MEIIFNADDFGLTRGVNYAIIDGCNLGVIKSTTMMANGAAFKHGLSLLKNTPDIAVGVHLTLTYGRPLLNTHRTIIDENGGFLSQLALLERIKNNEISLDEIKSEFLAQIKKIYDSGIDISHLDSHHHIHCCGEILKVVIEIANELNLPLRKAYHELMRYEEYFENVTHLELFSDEFYGDDLTVNLLIDLIKSHRNVSTLEFMCHPAYIDKELYEGSGYYLERINEYSILTNTKLLEFLKKENIKIKNYRTINL